MLVAATVVCQHHGRANQRRDDSIAVCIAHVHGVPVPCDDPTPVVHQPATRDSDPPATRVSTVVAQVVRASTVTDGKQPFNRIAVTDGEEGWVSQKQVTPVVMCCEQALETRAFWPCAVTEPITVIPFEPAGAGANEAAVAREQDANRYQLARIHRGLRMLRDGGQAVVHKAEHVEDTVVCSHGVSPRLVVHARGYLMTQLAPKVIYRCGNEYLRAGENAMTLPAIIPGLRGLPMVGVTPRLLGDPLEFMVRIQRHYGDLVKLNLGRHTMYLAAPLASIMRSGMIVVVRSISDRRKR